MEINVLMRSQHVIEIGVVPAKTLHIGRLR